MLKIGSTRSAANAFPPERAGSALLVSVRSPAEALAALAGGADLIDVKEPARGPLGPPDRATLAAIVRAVAGRAPVTAACGELSDHVEPPAIVRGVAAYKVGLAGAPVNWPDRLGAWRQTLPETTTLVPAAYWDKSLAGSPSCMEVLEVASRLDGWMVLDTWDKSAGGVPLHDPALGRLLEAGKQAAVRIALAGGLTFERLPGALRLAPALVGVRGGACIGGREGRIDRGRVRQLADQIQST